MFYRLRGRIIYFLRRGSEVEARLLMVKGAAFETLCPSGKGNQYEGAAK